MKKASAIVSLLIFVSITNACHQSTNSNTGSDNKPPVSLPSDAISETRAVVHKEPVAVYSERTDNPLNNWYFSVKVFETPLTFHYLISMQFEETRGEDTLRLPNYGVELKPVIQKGPDKYSCILGFMGKDNEFKPYKKIFVKDGRELKLVTLHHYGVVTTEER